MTFAAAEKFCDALGARLCTASEVEGDETGFTGCSVDNKRTWTQDTCSTGSGRITLAGRSANLALHPLMCSDLTAKLSVRCCADQSACVTIIIGLNHTCPYATLHRAC